MVVALIGAAHALDLMVFGNGLALPFLGAFKGYEQTATTVSYTHLTLPTK